MKNKILKLLKFIALRLMDYITIFLVIFAIFTTLAAIYFSLHPTSVPLIETLQGGFQDFLVYSFFIAAFIIFYVYLNSEFYIMNRKTYLFSWDKIPIFGQNRLAIELFDQNRLLIEFLKKNYSIDWIKKGSITLAKIEKIDDDKTIRVFTEKNWLSLRLNDEKSKLNLTIDDGRTDEFVVKTENGKLYIYGKPNKKYIYPNHIPIVTYLREYEEELYPRVPFFLITFGYAIIFTLAIYNINNVGLGEIGISSIYSGFLLIYIKRLWEHQIYYSLEKANLILDKIDENNKNPKDINILKRYINLTFKNINKKLGSDIELKTREEINESSKVEDTLIKYLPYYLKFGDKEQLYSAKTHLKTMLNSVDVDDKIKWKEFTDAAMSLNREITTYLRENNFNLTYRKLPRQLDWIYRNQNTIIQIIGLIIPIIIFLLQNGKGS